MKRLLPFALGGALLGTVGGVALAVDAWWATWLVWFAYFAVVEGMALFNSRAGDTLSEHVWAWFGTKRHPADPFRPITGWTRLRRFVLLAFLAWLSLHFLTGGLF
ncbi:hypothetical protein [Micromonospora sp. KC213]|uniref:hypothetical protein n=1 Tax=Micromonospora sp. KC213 TaxID=2530378 RepID=UPI0010527882|nr:hypothetical protein [Micromonospora sp. KC213]TDC29976.1 hypothetical protein E1166_29405 [Micromonospora sp. KC213]